MKKKKGIFIVIDGIDGTGKATQTELLVKRLTKEGIKARKIDFPGYERNVFGKLIGECLVGKRGDFLHVDPYVGSTLYAADRFESSSLIKEWIAKGYVVIADRYVSSNQIHQGGKIKNLDKKKEFLNWLETIEYKIFKIPKPKVILYLHLPVSLSVMLLEKKSAVRKKRYMEGMKKDKVESSMKYLENSRKNALQIISKNNKWIKIECSLNGRVKTRENIHELIYSEVEKILRRSK